MTATDVLIIDDSKVITKLTKQALLLNQIENHFFDENHIYIAYDGMQAFEMLGQYPQISLVISDLMMPELTGEELIEILIDTNKIKDLAVFMMTTKINKNSISLRAQEYIRGIIFKPFRNTTFSVHFNELQKNYDKKIQNQKEIKIAHRKQRRFLENWIQEYCDNEKLEFTTKTLNPLLEEEFDHFSVIDKDEYFMIFQSVLAQYLEELQSTKALNEALTKKIFNMWSEPEKYRTIDTVRAFKEIISEAKDTLDDKSNASEIRNALIMPISNLIRKMKSAAKTRQTLSYDHFYKYFKDLVKIFTEIDQSYDSTEILTSIENIQEVLEVQKSLEKYSDNIAEIFSGNFTADNRFIGPIGIEFKKYAKLITQDIIPLFIHATNSLLWQKAKKSQKIVSYLKQNLHTQMINTHNLLFHARIISTDEIQIYKQYDHERIYLVTKDLEIMKLFKNSLTKYLPALDVHVFKNISVFNSEVKKQSYEKLVIDFDFSNDVYNDGLQLLNILKKQHVNIENMMYSGNVYILATLNEIELLQKKKVNSNCKILLKPMSDKNILDRFWFHS